MNMTVEKRGFGWGPFVVGVLFILVSLLAFWNPLGNLYALAVLFGILALISGTWFVTNRLGSNFRLLIGILEILIGILLIANPQGSAAFLAILFAFWFIAESVSNLFLLGYYRMLGNGYFWFMLIVNVLGILAGAIMLYQPLVLLLTVSFIIGFYFMLVGIGYLLIAFSNPTIRIRIDDES